MARRMLLVVIALLFLGGGQLGAEEQAPTRPLPRPQASQTTGTSVTDRVFISVNGGFQSGDVSFADTRTDPWFGESASWTADYNVKSGPEFDVTGGVRLWQGLLLQATYGRFTDTRAALITGQVPHPFFFGQARGIEGESTALKQQEQSVHIAAAWVVPAGRRFDVGVFAGPSLYMFKRDLVADVTHAESYPYDSAAFSSAMVETVSERAVGFNVGADVTWRFSRLVGLGAVVRFTRARLDLDSPAHEGAVAIDIGGLQVGGGLRFRFGAGAPTRRVPPAERERTGTAPLRPTSSPEVSSEPPQPRSPGTARDRRTAVLRVDAPVFVVPDGRRTPLDVLRAGTRLKVRSEAGEWLEVEFSDPRWGSRVGYVLTKNCDW